MSGSHEQKYNIIYSRTIKDIAIYDIIDHLEYKEGGVPWMFTAALCVDSSRASYIGGRRDIALRRCCVLCCDTSWYMHVLSHYTHTV